MNKFLHYIYIYNELKNVLVVIKIVYKEMILMMINLLILNDL